MINSGYRQSQNGQVPDPSFFTAERGRENLSAPFCIPWKNEPGKKKKAVLLYKKDWHRICLVFQKTAIFLDFAGQEKTKTARQTVKMLNFAGAAEENVQISRCEFAENTQEKKMKVCKSHKEMGAIRVLIQKSVKNRPKNCAFFKLTVSDVLAIMAGVQIAVQGYMRILERRTL